MGQSEYSSPDAWGMLVSRLLEHRLATLLSQADISTLNEVETTAVLYQQLRSFMALKSKIKSSQPQSDVLRPAHEALLNFASRLFMAAHQALLHDSETKTREQPIITVGTKWQHKVAVPSSRFLLEWQLVRLKAARERLILELADLSERHQNTFRDLRLPEAIGVEVESARLHITDIWKKLPTTASQSAPSGETPRQTVA
jgi:hypothetical protein